MTTPTIRLTIKPAPIIRGTVRGIGLPGPPGADAELPEDIVLLADMQAAPTWAAVYSTIIDPQIAGVPWNNDTHLVFSGGPGIIDGRNASSAAYFLLLFEDL